MATSASGGDEGIEGKSPALRPLRWRWVVRLLRVSLLVYVSVAVLFVFIQTWLIFPGSQTQGSPEAVVRPSPGTELVELTTGRGDRVVALFGRALAEDGSPRQDAPSCPTILYFYGNGMCLRDCSEEFDSFRRLGCNVLIPDYVGYGMSGGKPSEMGCRETAEAAFAYLGSRSDLDRGRIVAVGWSLGGAVALDLASRHPFAGVVTFCTFTRMADMARKVVPFLPVSLLLRHRFENLSKIAEVGCPVLIGHGRRDPIIPFSMADRLAEAVKGPVTRVTIEEAGHNDFFDLGGERIRTPLRQFIDHLPRRP